MQTATARRPEPTTPAARNWLQRASWTDLFMWTLGGFLILLIVVGSIRSLMAGRYSAAQWIDFVIFGIAQGSVYSLIALGYTLVYGILRMINFAHGEVFMIGAFTTFFLANALDDRGFINNNLVLSIILLTLVSAGISMLVAVLLERIAYRPLRGAPRLVPLITAIGASFFLQYTARGLYGSGNKSYPVIEPLQGKLFFGPIGILRTQVVVIVSAVILMAALYTFVQRSKTGKAMRAVAEDKEAAALMGVDVDRTIVITFAIGGALAGAAGILYGLMFRQVHFFIGFVPGIKAFTAAVLGGIGNIPGAMLGGLFLGVFESLGPSLFLEGLGIPSANQLKDVIAFTMLVLVLIFRPTGILGERLAEKKA
ncbi:MAG TPA: branched-chain amino acid ABC transporter permease [Ardenticatenaceae bacterium]|jgi:branched-chain amino acid transport system permease protein